MATDPAAFLRSLGDEAVVAIEARDGRISRLGAVSQLQAVGVAFVMVGLLAAQEGETILGEIAARFDAVGARLEGVAGGELTVGSEVASFWARRSRGADDLWAVPVRVAVPQLELTLGAAAVFIDSLILTPVGLRGRGRAEARFAGEAHGGLITRWSDLTAVDDRGRSYQLKPGGGVTHIERRGGAARWWRWTGNWTSAPVMPADTAWLDVYAEGSQETARIVFSELLTVPTGPAENKADQDQEHEHHGERVPGDAAQFVSPEDRRVDRERTRVGGRVEPLAESRSPHNEITESCAPNSADGRDDQPESQPPVICRPRSVRAEFRLHQHLVPLSAARAQMGGGRHGRWRSAMARKRRPVRVLNSRSAPRGRI
jgi:hypothetical protein